MKWVTRERPNPWLIQRFLYVPADKVLSIAKESVARETSNG